MPVLDPPVATGATAAGMAAGEEAELDALLEAITALKAEQKRIEQQLEPLLAQLDGAMAAGRIDPAFSHNDWAFTHNPGRLSYTFPPQVLEQEQRLRELREAAIRQGTAVEKRGRPFWTIRAPRGPLGSL